MFSSLRGRNKKGAKKEVDQFCFKEEDGNNSPSPKRKKKKFVFGKKNKVVSISTSSISVSSNDNTNNNSSTSKSKYRRFVGNLLSKSSNKTDENSKSSNTTDENNNNKNNDSSTTALLSVLMDLLIPILVPIIQTKISNELQGIVRWKKKQKYSKRTIIMDNNEKDDIFELNLTIDDTVVVDSKTVIADEKKSSGFCWPGEESNSIIMNNNKKRMIVLDLLGLDCSVTFKDGAELVFPPYDLPFGGGKADLTIGASNNGAPLSIQIQIPRVRLFIPTGNIIQNNIIQQQKLYVVFMDQPNVTPINLRISANRCGKNRNLKDKMNFQIAEKDCLLVKNVETILSRFGPNNNTKQRNKTKRQQLRQQQKKNTTTTTTVPSITDTVEHNDDDSASSIIPSWIIHAVGETVIKIIQKYVFATTRNSIHPNRPLEIALPSESIIVDACIHSLLDIPRPVKTIESLMGTLQKQLIPAKQLEAKMAVNNITPKKTNSSVGSFSYYSKDSNSTGNSTSNSIINSIAADDYDNNRNNNVSICGCCATEWY